MFGLNNFLTDYVPYFIILSVFGIMFSLINITWMIRLKYLLIHYIEENTFENNFYMQNLTELDKYDLNRANRLIRYGLVSLFLNMTLYLIMYILQ